MPDAVSDRLRDRLAVNPPYEGVLADAYDTWLPGDATFADDVVYERLLAEVDGPVLELGCGTGRPLLRWLAAGHDVEGVDASADMLAVLRRNAAALGLDPVVHQGDLAPLDLGRRYAALLCPAGTFLLVDDLGRAAAALAAFAAHLRPGGVLALTLDRGDAPAGDPLTWRLRRTGTLADGTTVVVHEAVHRDDEAGVQVVYNRLETYDGDGRQLDTWLRRHRLRCWTRDDIAAALAGAGFIDVRAVGDDRAWVSIATRP